jgi:hypothetical protein
VCIDSCVRFVFRQPLMTNVAAMDYDYMYSMMLPRRMAGGVEPGVGLPFGPS